MVWPPKSGGKVSAASTAAIARGLTSSVAVWQALFVGDGLGDALGSREVRSRARARRRATSRARARAACAALSLLACTPTALDTVDLGDHPEPAERALDEDVFHCQIQPNVLTAAGCASGLGGESGSCHTARSALRLVVVSMPAVCQGGLLVGGAPPESIVNFERVRSSIGVDADTSPLYRRPLGLDSHPRAIFAAGDPPAILLRDWLNQRASP